MDTTMDGVSPEAAYPVKLVLQPQLEERNRLTTAFRFFLAIPHILLVGGPIMTLSWGLNDSGAGLEWGATGLLGAVACLISVIAWFAILFTGRHPKGLWDFAAYYMRWRVRAISYLMLLRDDYPPFGDDAYPAEIVLPSPEGERDRVGVAFRLVLAIPHFIVMWFLSVAWGVTTAIAWIAILFTGKYPEGLYGFAMGVFAWGVRLEAYILLMRDEYPPFTLRV